MDFKPRNGLVTFIVDNLFHHFSRTSSWIYLSLALHSAKPLRSAEPYGWVSFCYCSGEGSWMHPYLCGATPWKINMEPNVMEVWNMTFLYHCWVILRFHDGSILLFRGIVSLLQGQLHFFDHQIHGLAFNKLDLAVYNCWASRWWESFPIVLFGETWLQFTISEAPRWFFFHVFVLVLTCNIHTIHFDGAAGGRELAVLSPRCTPQTGVFPHPNCFSSVRWQLQAVCRCSQTESTGPQNSLCACW